MRLIDADALLRKWQDVLNEKADEKGTVAYITFELFVDRLKEEPTIDAVPVVHGRWVNNGIPDSMLSGCSVCGCPYGSSGFRYCPHCGAKMDGDEE